MSRLFRRRVGRCAGRVLLGDATDLPVVPSHPFCRQLNELLRAGDVPIAYNGIIGAWPMSAGHAVQTPFDMRLCSPPCRFPFAHARANLCPLFMRQLPYRRFVLVVDDFYVDPDAVRVRALGLSFYEPRWLTGLRSRVAYYPPDTRMRLERAIGRRIVCWRNDSETGHGVFYKAFGAGPNKEVPGIHFDEPADHVTGVIYLTPRLPVTCGTSLWLHKATGLSDVPSEADSRRLSMTMAQLNKRLEQDATNRSKWTEIDRIGYRYNRLVCYPSGMLHSATRHYGWAEGNVRLYQTFRFRIRREA